MELATITLKLSGQTANTVVKKNVTPAQAAIYAMLHGEDCIQALSITGVDKSRSIPTEIDRLRAEFTSVKGIEALDKLFPGRFPQLPSTFSLIGFEPTEFSENVVTSVMSPEAQSEAAARIKEKIRKGMPDSAPTVVPNVQPVNDSDRVDLLDNNGAQDVDFGDDPLDAEISRMKSEGGK